MDMSPPPIRCHPGCLSRAAGARVTRKREAVLRAAVALFLEQGYHPRHACRGRGTAEHHQARALQLFSQQGRNPVRVLGDGTGTRRRPYRRHRCRRRRRPRQAAQAGRRLCRGHGHLDFGASLVRFDVRDLNAENAEIVRAGKRSIDHTFRSYITQGISDGSIKRCDVPSWRPSPLPGSLNWIGRLVSIRRDAVTASHRRTIHRSSHRGTGARAGRRQAARPVLTIAAERKLCAHVEHSKFAARRKNRTRPAWPIGFSA